MLRRLADDYRWYRNGSARRSGHSRRASVAFAVRVEFSRWFDDDNDPGHSPNPSPA